jgi:hypothetical protein
MTQPFVKALRLISPEQTASLGLATGVPVFVSGLFQALPPAILAVPDVSGTAAIAVGACLSVTLTWLVGG